MAPPTEIDNYPLCRLLLSGYLAKREDPTNFPPGDLNWLQRYERLFTSAIRALGISSDDLRRRPEFNFDSGDAGNLESAVAVLRAVISLDEKGFTDIVLIAAKSTPVADIRCVKEMQRVCCEVKAITKQSGGRAELFLAEQVDEKIRETIPRVRRQLQASVTELHSDKTIAVYVMNWLLHSVTLAQSDFQLIVDALETEKQVAGIDGFLFITYTGQAFGFFSENGRGIAW